MQSATIKVSRKGIKDAHCARKLWMGWFQWDLPGKIRNLIEFALRLSVQRCWRFMMSWTFIVFFQYFLPIWLNQEDLMRWWGPPDTRKGEGERIGLIFSWRKWQVKFTPQLEKKWKNNITCALEIWKPRSENAQNNSLKSFKSLSSMQWKAK